MGIFSPILLKNWIVPPKPDKIVLISAVSYLVGLLCLKRQLVEES